ncbi:MAG: nucleotidyltransferase domain-containing protein [Vicinamibacterales bacterium]
MADAAVGPVASSDFEVLVSSCLEMLAKHESLARRRSESAKQVERVSAALATTTLASSMPISIFCAGSLARQEAGEHSDLDIFVVSEEARSHTSRLREYTLFAELIQLNSSLGFPEFSNDGQFLKICPIKDLIEATGSARDDSDNLFTTRLLMVLESAPLLNPERFAVQLRLVADNYYRDNRSKKSFRPLFLLNDLLRYWRTLCLNYEERRHDRTNTTLSVSSA